MSRLAGRISYARDASPQSNPPNEPRQTSSEPSEYSRGSSGRGRRGNGSWRQHDRLEDREEVTDRQEYTSNRGKPRGGGRFENQNHGSRGVELLNERPRRAEQQPERPRKPTRRVEEVLPSEEMLDIEDIITQISDLTVRSDRSAAQIKRNILGSRDLLDTMEEEDWQKVCEAMMTTALDQGEPEFVADMIVALFKNDLFSTIMSDELMTCSSKHIIEGDEQPLPALLAAILCAYWPRQYAKAFDSVNRILYTTVCVVKGWIEVLKEDTERYFKAEKKPSYQPMRRGESEEREKEAGEEEEKVIEDPQMVCQCALALSDLCDTAQKQLWTNWMSVTDEIYECIRPAITHNPNLDGSIKARLLNTLLQMSQSTTRHAPSRKNIMTQTVSSTSSE